VSGRIPSGSRGPAPAGQDLGEEADCLRREELHCCWSDDGGQEDEDRAADPGAGAGVVGGGGGEEGEAWGQERRGCRERLA
jgi:hypothetical protein